MCPIWLNLIFHHKGFFLVQYLSWCNDKVLWVSFNVYTFQNADVNPVYLKISATCSAGLKSLLSAWKPFGLMSESDLFDFHELREGFIPCRGLPKILMISRLSIIFSHSHRGQRPQHFHVDLSQGEFGKILHKFIPQIRANHFSFS